MGQTSAERAEKIDSRIVVGWNGWRRNGTTVKRKQHSNTIFVIREGGRKAANERVLPLVLGTYAQSSAQDRPTKQD